MSLSPTALYIGTNNVSDARCIGAHTDQLRAQLIIAAVSAGIHYGLDPTARAFESIATADAVLEALAREFEAWSAEQDAKWGKKP